jgi:hypothetical protein
MALKRQFSLFSACGLNCGLCPRYHTDGDCPGCGGENFSEKYLLPVFYCGQLQTSSCGILSCTERHNIEYCYLHNEYPCEKYNKWKIDLFITHQNMMKDFEKAKNIGIGEYKKKNFLKK